MDLVLRLLQGFGNLLVGITRLPRTMGLTHPSWNIERRLGVAFVALLIVGFCVALAYRMSSNSAEADQRLAELPGVTPEGPQVGTSPAPGAFPASSRAESKSLFPADNPFPNTRGAEPASPPSSRRTDDRYGAMNASSAGNGASANPFPPANPPAPPSTAAFVASDDRYGINHPPAQAGGVMPIEPPGGVSLASDQVPLAPPANAAVDPFSPGGMAGNPLRASASDQRYDDPRYDNPSAPTASLSGPITPAGGANQPLEPPRYTQTSGIDPVSPPGTFPAPPTASLPPPIGANAGLPPTSTFPSAPTRAAPVAAAGTAYDRYDPAPQQPVQVAVGQLAVGPNETFSTLAARAYGNEAYFKAMAEHNRHRFPHPDRLQVGDVVEVPPLSFLEQQYPQLCPKRREPPTQSTTAPISVRTGGARPGRVYKVREGDTLFDIARYELGKASRWVEIYQLNRDILGSDFDYLPPGTELILPDPRSGSSIAPTQSLPNSPSLTPPGQEPLTTQRPGSTPR